MMRVQLRCRDGMDVGSRCGVVLWGWCEEVTKEEGRNDGLARTCSHFVPWDDGSLTYTKHDPRCWAHSRTRGDYMFIGERLAAAAVPAWRSSAHCEVPPTHGERPLTASRLVFIILQSIAPRNFLDSASVLLASLWWSLVHFYALKHSRAKAKNLLATFSPYSNRCTYLTYPIRYDFAIEKFRSKPNRP